MMPEPSATGSCQIPSISVTSVKYSQHLSLDLAQQRVPFIKKVVVCTSVLLLLFLLLLFIIRIIALVSWWWTLSLSKVTSLAPVVFSLAAIEATHAHLTRRSTPAVFSLAETTLAEVTFAALHQGLLLGLLICVVLLVRVAHSLPTRTEANAATQETTSNQWTTNLWTQPSP